MEQDNINNSISDIKEIFKKIHYNITSLKQIIEKLNNAKN